MSFTRRRVPTPNGSVPPYSAFATAPYQCGSVAMSCASASKTAVGVARSVWAKLRRSGAAVRKSRSTGRVAYMRSAYAADQQGPVVPRVRFAGQAHELSAYLLRCLRAHQVRRHAEPLHAVLDVVAGLLDQTVRKEHQRVRRDQRELRDRAELRLAHA